jgi:hypothetical protein
MDQILDKVLSKKFGIVFLALWLLNGLAEKYEIHATLCIWMMFGLTCGYFCWQAWWDYYYYKPENQNDKK